ncbi:MAG: transcriptional regulator [Gemmatimonadetes bacterium]|nr:transcriptional regulator [Gemmatimonadota bacterium]
MNTTKLRKVTIIAEAVLEDRLLREVRELGSRGYTLTAVSGEGSRGVRASEWEGKNVQIEVLVSAEVADRLLDHLAANYFEHYAVVAYVVEVEVVRGDRYV